MTQIVISIAREKNMMQLHEKNYKMIIQFANLQKTQNLIFNKTKIEDLSEIV